ncbi:MAG TPA: hypothetical protein PKD64_09440 [Pirellulaceae bacterium]|nr:hypothetical protein [Pirellulaceae bacterium]HMO92410.1 hypothetical protein [Pirellulaceae bacterium]HMP69529.1 hypothetical protein [Pirellulaceae bacterium]
MKLTKQILYLALGVSAMIYVGCTPTEEPTPSGHSSSGQSNDHDHGHDHDDDHDHDHDHHHVHGPNHGERHEVAGAEFSIEICSTKGENFLTIYTLQKGSDDSVAIEAEKLVAHVTKGREQRKFEFLAENAEEGKASKFVVNDADAVAAYNAFGFEVEVAVGDDTYKVTVPKNPH